MTTPDSAQDRLAVVESHVVAAMRLLDTALGDHRPPNREIGYLDRAAELLDDLLDLPTQRAGAWEAPHVEALGEQLRDIRRVLADGLRR